MSKTKVKSPVNLIPVELHGRVNILRFILGVIVLIMTLAQLYSFEDFPDVVKGFGLPGGEAIVAGIAIFIALLEFASLPFLLSLRTNKKLLIISKYASFGVPIVWLFVSSWMNGINETGNAGVLGATIPVPQSIAVLIVTAIFMVAMTMVTIVVDLRHDIEKRRVK